MGDLHVEDPRLEALMPAGARLERLWTGGEWCEGPLWLPDEDAVIWSDIPNDRILRWSARGGATTWRAPSEYVNGNTLDREGRIVHCSHGARALQRTEPDGTVTTLADRFEGRRLNSPNDVVVQSDGTLWFTDPPYGIVSDREGHAAPSEIGSNLVFRLDPVTGDLAAVIEDMQAPNGLAFSPDERRLYVSDTAGANDAVPGERHHIRVWDVAPGGSPAGGAVFAEIEPGVPDGFRVDVAGNVWTSSESGVQVLAPDGTRLGEIPVPETVANCCFGGGRLYIAATSSLYAMDVATRGATER